MCGRAAFTTSPSVRSSMRSTPCVEGCCGPMFKIISSASRSASPVQSRLPLSIRVVLAMELLTGRVPIGRCHVEGTYADLLATHRALRHLRRRLHVHAVVELGIHPVLAERVPLPVVGQEDA